METVIKIKSPEQQAYESTADEIANTMSMGNGATCFDMLPFSERVTLLHEYINSNVSDVEKEDFMENIDVNKLLEISFCDWFGTDKKMEISNLLFRALSNFYGKHIDEELQIRVHGFLNTPDPDDAYEEMRLRNYCDKHGI